MATTKIEVQAVDNELYLLASTDRMSSELCHLKSGFNAPVSYVFNPGHILPPGAYTLTMIGVNWGGPQAFRVIVTTNGTPTTYTAPAGTQVGAHWTVSVGISV